MILFVNVQGREYEVVLSEREGRREMTINGQPVDVQYREADSLGQVILMHDGKSYGFSLEGGAHQVHATLAGYTYSMAMEDEH
ncbi:MAG: hypothetical protein R3F17_07350 [Planctomycetota bacterium]